MYNKLFNWSIAFLRCYVKPAKIEEIEGDLVELFELRSENSGNRVALFGLIWDVIRFFRFRYIKGLEDIRYLNSLTMIRNNFKIALRNILRHKFFAGINIAGLSIGITCCFMILLFIRHELNYDRFISSHERIMRISLNGYGVTPAPFAPTAKTEFPEIEDAIRIRRHYDVTIVFKDRAFRESNGLMVDSTFLTFFEWPLIEGNRETALKDPLSIVLTKSMVLKFFNRQDVLGQLVKIDGVNRKVTGIAEDFPDNSHLAFSYLVPLPTDSWVTNGSWTGNNFYSYAKLRKGASKDDLQLKFKSFVRKHMAEEILSFSGHANYDDYLNDEKTTGYSFFLFPIADLHLHHKWMSLTKEADVEQIYIFSIIALFVLLIACINFMNLSTARAGTRSKEVGIRKVLGSLKSQLAVQFLIESILISSVAIFLALGATLLLLTHFNELAGKNFSLSDVVTLKNMLILISIGIVTGLFAGLYPAFYMAAIKPVIALKGLFRLSGYSILRKGLVTFQFAISILLIICTVIVYAQVHFMTHKDMGIDTEHILVVKDADKMGKNMLVFKQQMSSLSEVRSVSTANSMPATWTPNWSYLTNDEESKEVNPDHIFVSKEYEEVMGIKLLSGNFFPGHATDSSLIIVNETLVKSLDWKVEEAIGKYLARPGEGKYKIAGVMQDFHLSSFRSGLRPLLLRYSDYLDQGEAGSVFMMLNVSGNYQHVISNIVTNWKQFAGNEILEYSNEILEYSFLDEQFNSLYDTERNFGKIFTTFSVMAIFIACLGLFALSAFMLQQRLKEVAMRKVLGATVLQIISLFVKSFSTYIVLGAIIATITGYILAEQWLENFAYQMMLNPLLFIVPVILVSAIALVTIAAQVLKSGNVNPATLLKNE